MDLSFGEGGPGQSLRPDVASFLLSKLMLAINGP